MASDFTERMPLIFFKYFWFICAAFMVVNVSIWQRRLAAAADRGLATRTETDRFIRWVAAWAVGGPLIAGGVSLAAGWTTPFCAGILSFDSVPRTLVSLLTVAASAALLWWLWRGTGADFLARVAPAFRPPATQDTQYSPQRVRVFLTAVVLSGLIGSAIAWRMAPLMPQMDCPAATGSTTTVHD
ncbi:MAG TPA: hypothetical protein VFW89_04685 [Gemmatimonadaceae bacterium]|nr:hypothetical protein [Gemmatimonadaceae bacterium]